MLPGSPPATAGTAAAHGQHGMASVSCLYFLPSPMALRPEGWTKCYSTPSVFNPGLGGHSTEPAWHGQSRCLYCPQPQVDAGGWISHLWPDLCAPEGSVCRRHRASAPTLSGLLVFALQRPPSHQTTFSPSPGVLSSCSPNMVCGVRRSQSGSYPGEAGGSQERKYIGKILSAAWERGGLAALRGVTPCLHVPSCLKWGLPLVS